MISEKMLVTLAVDIFFNLKQMAGSSGLDPQLAFDLGRAADLKALLNILADKFGVVEALNLLVDSLDGSYKFTVEESEEKKEEKESGG